LSETVEFVIWAPSFDQASGGAIALHALCDRLRQAGYSAALWPTLKPAPRGNLRLPSLRSIVGYLIKRNFLKFDRGPFKSRIARLRDLKNAIVIYPEIVAGNPLMAKHVVRWFLHRPGFHNGKVDYGADDLFFFYHEHFNDPTLNSDLSNRLTITWVNDVYRDEGAKDRRGTCYLLRKGKGRRLQHDSGASTLIDGRGPEEISRIFNTTERLYSYDLYTFYNVYAAICGCIPVVVPEEGLSEEAWLPVEGDRYGLAYGEHRIPWAVSTRGALIERLRQVRAGEEDMIRTFAAKCRAHFGHVSV
jgi:hypothetical protein